jgi:enoyl-CoA hydratase/carnithine racemase
MRELVLSSPGKNALSSSVLGALVRDLRAARDEPVLLTGAGDVFSAGLDLREVAALGGPEDARRLLAVLEDAVEALFTHPAPTVALVNGHAIAGGCVLALCCDFRVAPPDPRARIGLNEVALGLAFPPKTFAMVRARLGAAAAERVVLGAELLDPEGARAAGLLDAVERDARAAALARLALLGSHPREAYARAKARLRDGALRISPEEQRRFDEEVVPRWASEETRAAARRALAK